MSAGAAPALDLTTLLEQVEPARAELLELVRGILLDIDRAAPWDDLYCAPTGGLEPLGEALVATVDRIPSRIAETTSRLIAEADGGLRSSLEEAEFFFFGIHGMVDGELARLRTLLEQTKPGVLVVEGVSFDEVAELAADLKGKYSSALIGATSNVVGRGRWPGSEIEVILFPERVDEHRRTRDLLDSLRATLETIRSLPAEMGYEAIVRSWRRRERVDPYALAELSDLRGRIGRLLKVDPRRALYSGDYHQLRHREVRLSTRINEIESLHRATWSGLSGEMVFDRLVALALETAAILDIGLLESLVGREVLSRLRRIVEREGGSLAAGGSTGSVPELPDSLDGIPAVMLEEDLATFLELLLGAVSKRVCLAEGAAAPVETSKPAVARTSASSEVVAAELHVLEALRTVLLEMQSSENAHWNNLRMLDQLLKRRAVIPGAMLTSARPFLEEIQLRLLPFVEPAVAIGALPPWIRPKLRGYCEALSSDSVDPKIDHEVPDAMNRVLRLVRALSEQVDEQIARRSETP